MEDKDKWMNNIIHNYLKDYGFLILKLNIFTLQKYCVLRITAVYFPPVPRDLITNVIYYSVALRSSAKC